MRRFSSTSHAQLKKRLDRRERARLYAQPHTPAEPRPKITLQAPTTIADDNPATPRPAPTAHRPTLNEPWLDRKREQSP